MGPPGAGLGRGGVLVKVACWWLSVLSRKVAEQQTPHPCAGQSQEGIGQVWLCSSGAERGQENGGGGCVEEAVHFSSTCHSSLTFPPPAAAPACGQTR